MRAPSHKASNRRPPAGGCRILAAAAAMQDASRIAGRFLDGGAPAPDAWDRTGRGLPGTLSARPN
jgi:hypothetical protein